ncbi:ScpA family protein [Hyphococcus flavus]|uniref:Segregation and condensation protein A n=1 Tax=Hyphococcus flavus TaxID=1866326 RepID=A0AAE9ZDH0_9PROT|nr:ScpA family protein [Hyphococcus flavus]WDI30633.1 ScpA family protein [Hyphococcus flavus]
MADGENMMMAAGANQGGDAFDAPVRDKARAQHDDAIDALIVNIEGYEGPLDVLLDLARHQKVDIRKISMVALVDQYLLFVEAAKDRNLELAADYLVMASWLAYLKSKLLLPVVDEDGDEPTADEMAARLAFQLQRLEAMRKAVEDLQGLPQEGIDFFTRGAPEGVRVTQIPEWQADLVDLLKAYATQRIAAVDRDYHIQPPAVFSIEAARMRLERILGSIPEWTELETLAGNTDVDAPKASVLASSFNAALEFAKAGQIDLRQLGTFEPIYIKTRQSTDEKDDRNGS